MTTQATTPQSIRIRAEDLKERLHAGQSATILDVRAPRAWDSSDEKIAGAIRVPPAEFRVDPSWPRDRLTAVY